MNLRGKLVRIIEVQQNFVATQHTQSRRTFNVRLDEENLHQWTGGQFAMHIEERLSETVLNSWKLTNQRFSKFISQFSDKDLQKEIAPGRNRVLYVVGHLAATNDRLFPLLRIGQRKYPELDPV